MDYIVHKYLYASTVKVKNIDLALKKFLMKHCLELGCQVSLTPLSGKVIEERSGELQPETLKLIVATVQQDLFKKTLRVMPNELLIQSMEHDVLAQYLYNLPKEKFEVLLPQLLDLAKIMKNGERWLFNGNMNTMLEYKYTWENGGHILSVAEAMLSHEKCTPKLCLELTRRFPSLAAVPTGRRCFDEWLKQKKLKIVEGENYETGEPAAAEL